MLESIEDEAVMSFKNIGISTVNPPKPILSNISGYIQKGGITAVMGASASGKSLLMQVLAGRIQDLSVTGDFLIEGMPVDQKDISNAVAYVPQDDILIGELSAREILRDSAAMKRNKALLEIDADVHLLLGVLGLDKVADNPIGTAFIRGLSGGQKKRVDIGAELVASPLVLFLDEPTSGLDSSIAFEVLNSIRKIVKASNGKLSVMLSIHQPNSRILELFDHVMLLGGGAMNFFGTVSQSIEYFISIGFTPPKEYTPTDYFLQISDSNFGTRSDFDFEGSFSCSIISQQLMLFLDKVQRDGAYNALDSKIKKTTIYSIEEGMIDQGDKGGDYERYADSSNGRTSFWRQYYILVNRDFVLAARDPALYYLQFVLVLTFGFLVGAAFLRLKYQIGAEMNNIPASILWIVLMMAYIQIFKVYHLTRGNMRLKHEMSNNTYTVYPAFFAELTTTAIGVLSFTPGAAVAYFMMGYPNEAYPFLLFHFWLTALTAESMINFITKFSTNATVNIVISQAVMVILTVFGGGVFIPWNKVPMYWIWLQELSIFTQASRSAFIHVYNYINFQCDTVNGVCFGPLGDVFPCDFQDDPLLGCYVKGRTVLYLTQGTSRIDSQWIAFGWLVLLLFGFRVSVLFLMFHPVDRLTANFKKWWSGGLQEQILKGMISLRRVEGQLVTYISENTPKIASSAKSVIMVIDGSKSHNYDKLFDESAGFTSMDDSSSRVLGDYTHDGNSESFCLVWKDLSVLLKKKGTKLIDGVSGIARSGRVLALMGPSGAGKTTLLNALGNRAPYADVVGDITFGRRAFIASDLYFVPQFDEVNTNFTVFEQMELVGLLKCRDREAMYTRLKNLIRILGLHTKTNVLCSALTGGELKRVSVGMGMISNPSVLFLDEPTTGLDSAAAFSIVKHLVELSNGMNVAVIMTIHQPSEMVFDMLQDLLLLEGGRLTYTGPLPGTEKYFKTLGYECPKEAGLADFYLDLIYKAPELHEKSWKELYQTSTFGNNMSNQNAYYDKSSPLAPAAIPSPSSLSSLYELLLFFFKYYTRDQGFYFLRITVLICIAFFLGTLYVMMEPKTEFLSRYSGAVFFNIWTVLFSAVAATGLITRDRRHALEQVKNAVIAPGVYCLAQFMASLPFNFIAALTFQSIFHWLTNINPNGEVFIYAVLVTCGHLLLMEAVMLSVVQALQNAMLSVTFAMVVLGSLFLFSGFFIKINDMPHWISWISYIIPTKYSFDGYLYMIFHSQSFFISGSDERYISGDEVLSQLFGQEDVKPWPMFVTLLAWVALIRLGHYLGFLYEVMPYLSKAKKN